MITRWPTLSSLALPANAKLPVTKGTWPTLPSAMYIFATKGGCGCAYCCCTCCCTGIWGCTYCWGCMNCCCGATCALAIDAACALRANTLLGCICMRCCDGGVFCRGTFCSNCCWMGLIGRWAFCSWPCACCCWISICCWAGVSCCTIGCIDIPITGWPYIAIWGIDCIAIGMPCGATAWGNAICGATAPATGIIGCWM